MTDGDAILVRVLAHTDALLLCVRNWTGCTGGARWVGLDLLRNKGIPFRVNAAGDEQIRKAGERELVDLARKGLLRLARRPADLEGDRHS